MDLEFGFEGQIHKSGVIKKDQHQGMTLVTGCFWLGIGMLLKWYIPIVVFMLYASKQITNKRGNAQLRVRILLKVFNVIPFPSYHI